MNRNILKWILIAAVVLGAAAYLILSETPSKKEPKKEKIVVGHSKAFKIEPIEGIQISAGENALDYNRDFSLTFADEATYDRVSRHLVDNYGVKPLLAMELDAGLQPEEVLPGTFQMALDLKKMGIPECLYDRVKVYRTVEMDGKTQSYEYSTDVDHSGMLTLSSSQNCCIFVALGTAAVFYGLRSFVHTAQEFDTRNYFGWNWDPTTLAVPWDDPYGDFTLIFRFKDTERYGSYQAYVDNEKRAMEIIDELYEQTEAEYERRVNRQATGKEDLWWWDKLYYSKERDAAKATILKEAIFEELRDKNDELKALEAHPDSQLPASIQYIIEAIKMSNRYLSEVQQLQKLNYRMDIFLVGSDVIGKDNGRAVKRIGGQAFLLINYQRMFEGNHFMDTPGKGQSCILSIAHELFHARQQTNYCAIKMGMYAAESTAAVLETDAMYYFIGKGQVKVDPKNKADIARVELSPRTTYYAFSQPLDRIGVTDRYYIDDLMTPSRLWGKTVKSLMDASDVGYTLGSVIEAMRENVGKPNLLMKPFVLSYSKWGGTFSTWIKKSIGMTDAQFDAGWVYFFLRNAERIQKAQETKSMQDKEDRLFRDSWERDCNLTESNPIYKLDTKKENWYVQTYNVNSVSKTKAPFSVFIDCPGAAPSPYVYHFITENKFQNWEDKNKEPLSPQVYLNAGVNRYHLAQVVTSFKNSDPGHPGKYYIVALFAPNAPDITKVKDDHISFVVSKPERVLTKNKFITGAVVTYTDKNGNTQTLDVNPKQFGKRVKWPVANASKKGNAFTLTAHWYYKPDDQTTYVSPESKMAEWGGHLDEQEKPQAEEKAPETNYWKLVNVRMEKTNTSYKESQNPDEEVDADYRSIYFAVDRTEKSCTFMGIAATEEVHEDNTRHYVRDLYLDGTLTFTEPPKFWTPGRQYKAICEVADDPYLLKISEPFVFEAENSSSQPTVCLQSKNDKIDNGWSSLGETNWLRSASTTFEAHSPEKDSPKFFTLTQSYSIAERPYSDLMAKVVLHYDYEWVGEPEEETTEEEPEGSGCWRLVKVVERDENNNISSSNYQLYVTGSKGQFTVNSIAKDVFDTESYKQVSYNVSRSFAMEQPKKAYYPRDIVKLSVECSAESGGGHDPNTYCQVAFLKSKEFTDPNNPRLVHGYAHDFIGYSDYGPITTSYKYEYSLPEPSSPTFFDKFCIMESAAGRRGTLYYYEWVEGEPEDITVERMDFVAYLPESPVAKHIDCWPRQIYGRDKITTYKEGSGYRVVGVSDMKYGTFFDEDARVTYQDRMEITLDKDFNVIRGTFTWDLSYYSEDPYVVNAELGKYDKKLHLQFEKTPDDGKTHKYHYRIVSLDASTRVTTPKDEQFYVLTTGDLQYNWVESDGKDHYDEYGCTPNCTPMDCWEMAKIVSDKDHNVEIDLTIKKQKH